MLRGPRDMQGLIGMMMRKVVNIVILFKIRNPKQMSNPIGVKMTRGTDRLRIGMLKNKWMIRKEFLKDIEVEWAENLVTKMKHVYKVDICKREMHLLKW